MCVYLLCESSHEQVASLSMEDTLGLTSTTRCVQHEQWVLTVQWYRSTLTSLFSSVS